MQRRSLLMALGLSVASPPGVVRAQPIFPDRPVRIVVPFPPGGSYDVVTRLLSRPLQEAWPRGVVIDNRPGAGGNIPACLPFLLDGKLTGLGISSADRFQTFPAVPAIAETVPGFAMDKLVRRARSGQYGPRPARADRGRRPGRPFPTGDGNGAAGPGIRAGSDGAGPIHLLARA